MKTKKAKINLVRIFAKKEKIFWARTLGIRKKEAHWLSKKIVVISVAIWHYMVAFMHFLFEIMMFAFNKKQFKQNLLLLNHQSDMKLSAMGIK